MVAANHDHFALVRSLPQKIENPLRVWTTVHIIANSDLDGSDGRLGGKVLVDLLEACLEKIRAAMDIADCVDPHPIRKTWFSCIGVFEPA